MKTRNVVKLRHPVGAHFNFSTKDLEVLVNLVRCTSFLHLREFAKNSLPNPLFLLIILDIWYLVFVDIELSRDPVDLTSPDYITSIK